MSVQVKTNWFLPLSFIDACLIVIQRCRKSFIFFSIIYFVSFSLNYKQTALRLRLTSDCPLTPMWYFMCCVVGIHTSVDHYWRIPRYKGTRLVFC